MAKIPFDIKYRPQLESGEYKVETRNGLPVRIICWDRKTKDMEILALVYDEHIDEDNEDLAEVALNGRMFPRGKDHDYDLFIVTPEEELTEFEKCIESYIKCYTGVVQTDVAAKQWAAELLPLAREQFIKDGYVIEKKAFHDAVENISDKHQAEMSVEYSIHCKVKDGTRNAVMNWDEFQKVAQKFIDIGEAEALKDLPRWRTWGNGACGGGTGERPIAIVKTYDSFRLVPCLGIGGERFIMLDDLKKLPGFKED